MDEIVQPPKSEALRALYWRSEILQVMYWLRGEGFNDRVDLATLHRFLGVDAVVADHHLERLVADGLLVRNQASYALSTEGATEGELAFAATFADLVRPRPGPCSADCWCQTSPEEAAACAGDRALNSLH